MGVQGQWVLVEKMVLILVSEEENELCWILVNGEQEWLESNTRLVQAEEVLPEIDGCYLYLVLLNTCNKWRKKV